MEIAMNIIDNKIDTILVIDDEKDIRTAIKDYLELRGYRVITAKDAIEATKLLDREVFSLIISDICLQGMSGLDLLHLIKEKEIDIPLILMTGYGDMEKVMDAFKNGAYDFITKPFDMNEMFISVKNAVDKQRLKWENIQYRLHLEEMVKKRTTQLKIAYKNLEDMFLGTVRIVINTLEASDRYTKGHSERVRQYSIKLAKKLGLTSQEIRNLEIGSILHDIGKIGIDKTILHKNGPLNNDEYAIIKTHPSVGKHILEPIEFDEKIINIIYQHHERYDGQGYPSGLKRDDIFFLARLVTVVDAFDAMMSTRPYRNQLLAEKAIIEIDKNLGTQFDPEIGKNFIKLFNTDHSTMDILKHYNKDGKF
ncbi:MAG: two-component system response regulator [Candidatus Cloacimonadota bacterium]|nr:MAG: two-component system response regulator [Candidatus Cloacimonadota bacterium]